MGETYEGWICTDCLMFVANGETPPELDEAATDEWVANIVERQDGYHWAAGDESHEFSWNRCDMCGSTLGGSRHQAFTWAVDA